MNEKRIISFLKPNEKFRQSIPVFVESFTEYYGEERREEIERLFYNLVFIGYQEPSSLTSKLNYLERNKTKELLDEIRVDDNLPFTKEDLFGNNDNFKYNGLMPIDKFVKLLELAKQTKEERRKEFILKGYQNISSFLKDLTIDEYIEMYTTKKIPDKYENINPYIKKNIMFFIDENNIDNDLKMAYKNVEKLLLLVDSEIAFENLNEKISSEHFSDLKRIALEYQEKIKEYNAYKESFSKLYQSAKEIEESKVTLEKKHYKILIQENLDLIPDEEKQDVIDYLKGKNSSEPTIVNKLFGYGLKIPGTIENFSKENDAKLNDENTLDFVKNEIKNNRIKYFKLKGINLGDDYNAYLIDERVKEIWPTEEKVQRFIETKEQCISEYKKDYYLNNPEFKEIRQRLDSIHLLDKESDLWNEDIFEEKLTCVSPNIILTEHGYEMIPIVFVDFSMLESENKEHDIIHELNHVLELNLQSISKQEYNGTCGWDELSGKINQTHIETDNSDEKRKYELFNEIINELIAQEICDIHRKNNNEFIFDDQEHCKIKNTTSYERARFIVIDFFKEFKDKIIQSRGHGNIEIIYDEIGKENFEALNDLVNEFHNKFSGTTYYRLLESFQKEETNELTKDYYDILYRKEEIMNNMHMYQETKKRKEEVI